MEGHCSGTIMWGRNFQKNRPVSVADNFGSREARLVVHVQPIIVERFPSIDMYSLITAYLLIP